MNRREVEAALEEIENRNYAAALKLLAPLAEAGSPEAMCNLAILYQCGWGVQLDGKRAVALYEQVASLGLRERQLSAIALNNLATIYTTGLPGIEVDPSKAELYKDQARKLGFEMY